MIACRHHIYELIPKNVYQSLFGKTTTPENATFMYLRDGFRPEPYMTRPYCRLAFKTGIEKTRKNFVVNFYQKFFPRNDDRECKKVMLQILGECSPRGPNWYKLGAIHQAHWITVIL